MHGDRMRTVFGKAVLVAAVGLTLFSGAARAGGYYLEVETGAAFNGYNDVRIPPDTGTEFSFTDDFETDPTAFIRLRIGLLDSEKHELSIFAAPLRFSARGTPAQDLVFDDEVFSGGTRLEGEYRFDSYRITYLYGVYRSEGFSLDIGFTGKIRDAEISLSGGGKEAAYDNTGFVPLFAFGLSRSLGRNVRLLAEGDALASPGGQGRAEDIFLGMAYARGESLELRAGYRFLEGGADVDEVYSFALIHYLSLGIRLKL